MVKSFILIFFESREGSSLLMQKKDYSLSNFRLPFRSYRFA